MQKLQEYILGRHMISELTDIEYLIAFSDGRTAFSDACIRQASEGGRLYCERADDTYRGFLCTETEGRTTRILYAYTKPEFRGRGIFTSLAEHVVQAAEGDVRISIPEEHPCFPEVDAICRRLGFTPTESLHTFSFDRSQEAAWRRTKQAQRFDACCDLLRRNGCDAVPFADADEDILRQVQQSHISSFRNPFDPSVYFRLPSKKLSLELSCAAVKDGRLLSYALLSQQSHDAVVFEQMASAVDARNLGVILLPFVYSVDRFFDSGYRFWAFAIYPSNIESNRIRKTLEKEFAFEEKITRHYRKRSGQR